MPNVAMIVIEGIHPAFLLGNGKVKKKCHPGVVACEDTACQLMHMFAKIMFRRLTGNRQQSDGTSLKSALS